MFVMYYVQKKKKKKSNLKPKFYLFLTNYVVTDLITWMVSMTKISKQL